MDPYFLANSAPIQPVHQNVDFNRSRWEKETDWTKQGEEWSEFWGSSEAQWYGTLLPRLAPFLPAESVLEIAPGYGRWTNYLTGLSRKLAVVDLAENCIAYCRQRFNSFDHVRYFVNDGKSLAMIEDNSIDFAFSFDSLVHADIGVIENYIEEFSRILKPSGWAFIHHSNSKPYRAHFEFFDSLPRGQGFFHRRGLSDMRHLRNLSVDANDIIEICRAYGLYCAMQERINWGGRRLIDCISLMGKVDPKTSMPTRIVTNDRFMSEARHVREAWLMYRQATKLY